MYSKLLIILLIAFVTTLHSKDLQKRQIINRQNLCSLIQCKNGIKNKYFYLKTKTNWI
jgi:hypothetical protein